MNFKNVLGGLVLVLTVVAIATALPDIKRYIRISTM
jgi:hypothetical protein